MAFQGPEVSHADIESFHATHFSNDAVNLFEFEFLRPDAAHGGAPESYYYEEEEDDGLGYYPDGVKRTLTDEQIGIFRHSEMEALRRADRAASKQETTPDSEPAIDPIGGEPVHTPIENGVVSTDSAEGSEDGEIETEKPVLTKAEIRRQKKLRSRQRKKESHKFQPEKKPDLRKRTWDVVEAGMDALHYDDLGTSQDNASASATQRKQISYDD
ncbi:hypothetical protein F5B22DRAFT_538970 [Xylaria bambusicola]|uniref:uncharacterized protein n=1 Tax=Xylaria bambusicola TaxID=326684 RepID=UPI002007D3B5|nr:uncharacterized protein F5B22DRAFT_538970 [Xylaria bambusicola]KAI0521458.1 hypothetical protein F5B22DRAFT_538970 [Xylaria bambusicola]